MKQYLLLLISLIATVSFGQGSGDVVFYSNSGEKFYVVMNGVRQNMAPETNVKVQGLTNQWYGCKIISSTNSFELEKNIPVKFDTLITYQIVGKKGKYKLRYFSETPMKSAPTTGGQAIVTYSPTENTGTTTTTNIGTTGVGTTTSVGTTGTTTNTNVGTTGTTTTTNVGTTGTTGMTTTTNVGTTGVGTTTSVGTTGTTTNVGTTTTTTGTTTGTGNPETLNININVSETGAGINITGTGTGTGTTNTSTTTTNNGTSTVQTTTTTTTGGNGTTTYYEETTTTTTSTGNIYQDPDVTFTMTTTGTGTGTTNTGVGTTTTTTTGNNTNVGNTGTTTTNTTNYNSGNCYTSDADFAAIKKSVSAESFEDDQMRVAKMATKNKCLSVKQIGEMMKLFSFSEAQLEFAKYAYANCANKSDYYQLMEVLTFSGDKEALESFINAQ